MCLQPDVTNWVVRHAVLQACIAYHDDVMPVIGPALRPSGLLMPDV